jgi:hypothetical protein
MVDIDTFIATMYVMIDTFCQAQMPPEVRPGPRASLTRSEVLTLALVSQWRLFDGERAFYRYARRHLRPFFPALTSRPQLNRLIRRHHDGLIFFFRHLGETLQRAPLAGFQATDRRDRL